MADVFSAEHHGTADHARLEECLRDIYACEQGGAGVGDIKGNGVGEAKVTFELDGCTGLKCELRASCVATADAAAYQQVDILWVIF